ncbi:MAG: hypothetical protein JW941_09150 [Candidatus Coatesbacteria bacterium]|nr:hypothetical protein [Candidatus Coatesbacteria bacterium]
MKQMLAKPFSAFAHLAIIAFVFLGQLGCEKGVAPVKGFSAEPVNIAATELKAKCMEILRNNLGSENMDTRLRVALALTSAGDSAGIKDAVAIMAGRRREYALRAAHYFARNGLTPSDSPMIDAEAQVKKARGTMRYLAITVLGSSNRDSARELLTSILGDAGHPDLQVCAASALARRANRQGIDWLKSNVSTWLTFTGFDSFLFGRVADEGAIHTLIGALNAGADDSVRNAMLAAETTRDGRAASCLSILIGRKHGVRKTMAATVLAEFGGREGDRVLKEVMGRPMPAFPEVAWAAMGLASLGDPSGIWALVKFLEREKETPRGVEAASYILPCLQSPGFAVSASFQLWVSVNM